MELELGGAGQKNRPQLKFLMKKQFSCTDGALRDHLPLVSAVVPMKPAKNGRPPALQPLSIAAAIT